jgi:hypothetical protein
MSASVQVVGIPRSCDLDRGLLLGNCMLNKLLSFAFASTTLIAVAATGCASPEEIPEEKGDTTSNIGGTGIAGLERACGRFLTRNPACSAESFVIQLAKKAKGDVVGAIGAVNDAKTCIGNLASIGAVSTAAGPAAPVVLVGAAVIKGIETINACASFAMYLSDIGIVENISCFFGPNVAKPGMQDEFDECKCTYACTRQQSYKFGYLDRTNWCQCTDDAVEAKSD